MAKKASELTRTEQIRARRAEEQQGKSTRSAAAPERTKPMADRSRPAAAYRPYVAPVPGVTSRGNYNGVPLHQKNKNKARRQVYYNLGASGAEVRLPSFPAVAFGWRAVSGSLSLFLLVAIFTLWNSPLFRISGMSVKGIQRLTADEVVTAMNITGTQIIEIDPAVITKTLRAVFPDISEARVSVGLPAQIVVTLKERTPLLAWQKEDETLWIDQAGYAFSPRGEAGVDLTYVIADGDPPSPVAADAQETAANTDELDLAALLTPSEPSQYIATDLIQAIQAMKTQVPEGQSIAYSASYGLGWTDPQGWIVYFGKDLDQMDVKLEQYKAIVAQLTSQGIKPSLISVEYLHAPFYSVEH